MSATAALDRQSRTLGPLIARRFADSLSDRTRIGFARAFTAAVIEGYWETLQSSLNGVPSLLSRPPALLGGRLTSAAEREAEAFGTNLAGLDPIEAGYSIGSIYTAALPPKYRSEQGAYYTPPALSKRLIEMIAEAGIDWRSCRVLDGSCGGAAFLAPVALKMLEGSNADQKGLDAIARRLKGFEIDPFAAWMSQVLVEASLLPICSSPDCRLPQLVDVCNSLDRILDEQEKFDVVIGNPPYGRIKLDPYQRTRFARSLYGHANMYGVFTHAALGWLKDDGVIGYVTPTSMLGGQYFKALRALLAEEAPPKAIEFVSDRDGVFADVLQETMLAVYQRNGKNQLAQVFRSWDVQCTQSRRPSLADSANPRSCRIGPSNTRNANAAG
jgi:adenine-specific DNA-methyltransferase